MRREHELLPLCGERGDDNESGARSLSEGAKRSSHTSDIANVVSDVVSNGGGVAGIIFGDSTTLPARSAPTSAALV